MLQSRMEPSEQSGPDSCSQDVNPVFLQQLRELDIPEEAARQVGQYTEDWAACFSIRGNVNYIKENLREKYLLTSFSRQRPVAQPFQRSILRSVVMKM